MPAKGTTPRQFRLSEEVMAQLDRIAREHGLSSRAEAIRFMASREIRRLENDAKKTSRKSA